MARTTLTVNGTSHVVDVEPDCPLLYVLRDTLQLNNPRFGCGLGQCGACTVLLDTNPKPADSDVRRACESLICRCGSHTRIFSAVQRAATLLGNTAVKA